MKVYCKSGSQMASYFCIIMLKDAEIFKKGELDD